MSELTITVLRLGFLVLLWLFVLGVVGVLRGDLYGTRIAPPSQTRGQRKARESDERAQRVAQQQAVRASQAPRGRARQLVVTDGPLRGTTITLGSSPVVIGRAPDSTLVIDDDYASARHARLSPTPDGWVVEDLGSTNGTFIGKEQIVDTRVLPLRTPVRVGSTIVELRS